MSWARDRAWTGLHLHAREDSGERRHPGRAASDAIPDQCGWRQLDRHRARARRRAGIHGPPLPRRILGGRPGLALPVRRNIYTVPRHPELPFLDPHWIVRADGRREIGPHAGPVPGPYTYPGLFLAPAEA